MSDAESSEEEEEVLTDDDNVVEGDPLLGKEGTLGSPAKATGTTEAAEGENSRGSRVDEEGYEEPEESDGPYNSDGEVSKPFSSLFSNTALRYIYTGPPWTISTEGTLTTRTFLENFSIAGVRIPSVPDSKTQNCGVLYRVYFCLVSTTLYLNTTVLPRLQSLFGLQAQRVQIRSSPLAVGQEKCVRRLASAELEL